MDPELAHARDAEEPARVEYLAVGHGDGAGPGGVGAGEAGAGKVGVAAPVVPKVDKLSNSSKFF